MHESVTLVHDTRVGVPGGQEPGVARGQQRLRALGVPEHVLPAGVPLLAAVAPPVR